jgi:RHS repeat-associated protein
VRGTDTHYYHYNGIGTVTNLTDNEGNLIQSYIYDAFGNILSVDSYPPGRGTITNRYRFSTKEYSSKSGLIYFGARYYDPRVGRWITKDLIPAVNLYVYCKNNPLNLVDPFGLDTYYVNRVMGGESTQDSTPTTTPTNNPYSHSFVAITDNGTVTDTFSWGNGGQSRWFHNDPVDMAAAQKAIDTGVGVDWYGGEDLDPFVAAEYEKRKNETDPYNVATNNCKQKAGRLLKDAMQQKKKKEKLK